MDIGIMDFFVMVLGAAAAWVGVAALVQKRTAHRERDDRRHAPAAR